MVESLKKVPLIRIYGPTRCKVNPILQNHYQQYHVLASWVELILNLNLNRMDLLTTISDHHATLYTFESF